MLYFFERSGAEGRQSVFALIWQGSVVIVCWFVAEIPKSVDFDGYSFFTLRDFDA